MPLKIQEVISKKDQSQFNAFTRDLYKEDDEFISHINQDIEAIFSSDKNSEFENGEAKRWLAYDDDQIVGKVAAFFNRNTDYAGIGFFDSIDNKKVAHALFDTACNWLKESGFRRVEAPVNFGERDKYWGLMVEGFKSPSYQENYNFPYYQHLFESYGFEKSFEQTTSEVSPNEVNLEKYRRFTKRLEQQGGYNAKHFKLREMDQFVKDFTLIYNQAWKQHEHFVPFTEERVRSLFVVMKPIIREDILWFLYKDDKPIGFYLSVIDLNQIFKRVNGNMNWWGKLKFLYYLKTERIKKIRGIIFGMIPEFQNKGVYSIMIMKMYEVLMQDADIESSELAWIGDFNPKMHSLFASLNAQKTKVHYTFSKDF